MLDTITFDQLPQAVADILDGIAELKSICNDIRDKDSGKDVYLTVEELCAYPPPTTPRNRPCAAGNGSATSPITKTGRRAA